MKTPNKAFARTLRREPTEAERKLWRHLRNRQLAGTKFRRQQPFGPYVLDFYCAESKLAIELDGGQHAGPQGIDADRLRNEYLKREGLTVLRFWNNQVFEEFDGVLETIINAVPNHTPHPNPLPQGERGLKI